MKTNIVLVALFCAAAVWAALPHMTRGSGEPYAVVATAYTCEASASNPMYPCGRLRWGGNPYSVGLACPVEWRNRRFEVPGYGVLRCDDTPRDGYLNGLPHIDIRTATLAEARQWGRRRVTIYAVDGGTASVATTAAPAPVARPAAQPAAPAPQPAPPVAPPAVIAPEAAPSVASNAVAWALAQAPQGDGNTALARVVRMGTARQFFPALLEPVVGPAEQIVWLVSLWVPASQIPADTYPRDGGGEVAAQFFIFDASTGTLMTSHYVSKSTLDVLGWLPHDFPVAP